MRTDELTKTLPENHLMPTVKYGCVDYVTWCRSEARRINRDPSRSTLVQHKDNGFCCLIEMVEDDA